MKISITKNTCPKLNVCKKCNAMLPENWKYKRCASCLGIFWMKAIGCTTAVFGVAYGIYKSTAREENMSDYSGLGFTAEDFCSVCGKPENNMYIHDGIQSISPHCEICFDEYMSENECELNEHPYIYCCGIQHDFDEVLCRSCKDYF